MPERGEMTFDVRFGRHATARQAPQQRFSIVALGDFSGSLAAKPGAGSPLRRVPVTLDTLDQLIRQIGPQLSIAANVPLPLAAQLTFAELDDFTPDALITSVPLCRTLSSIIKRLAQAPQQAQALTELEAMTGFSTGDDATGMAAAPNPSNDGDDVLGRLLGQSKGSSQAADKVNELLQSTLSAAVKDAIVQPTPHNITAAQLLATQLLSECLRGVLADPGFAALERNWRGVDWLLRHLDDDEAAVEIIDVSASALTAVFAAEQDLEANALHRLLADGTQGGQPDLLLGLYAFRPDLTALVDLSRLAAIAARCDAEFVSHGELALCGCTSLSMADRPSEWQIGSDAGSQFWQELRQHPVADNLALIGPRFLLRQPYGPNSDPIDAFAFTELRSEPAHEDFCWGNPALLYACAVVHQVRRFDDLPMAMYEDGAGQALQPSAEVLLPDSAAARMAESGLLALRGSRNSGSVAF